MRITDLHPWDMQLSEAARFQDRLRTLVRIVRPETDDISLVAGADVSYSRRTNLLYAGVVVLSYPDLRVVRELGCEQEVSCPYVPGFLSFREAPAILRLFADLQDNPQIVFVDGQGIAHPRGMGLASHVGLFLDTSTIGCAKTRLIGDFSPVGVRKGGFSYLIYEGRRMGTVLRTRDAVKPLFVSPGHKMDIETARELTLSCTTRYRLPDPIRYAHLLATRMRKQEDCWFSESSA